VVGGAARLIAAGAAFAYLTSIAPALAQPYKVIGECRSGAPNGGYELRDLDGRLRVVGAFAYGRKTGTFIFWTSGGARLAVVPYDDDARSGTVASWYLTPDARVENGRKLEAPYVADRLHGVVRSWYPKGALRAEYRYEHGALAEAHAWTEASAPLSDADASNLALRDAEADQRFLDGLAVLVHDHLPHCD
jgi:antitoxin component YwqK of YwqJK toxin-antitoxin module